MSFGDQEQEHMEKAMKRIKCDIETRRHIPREARDSWAPQEWVPPGQEQEEGQFESVICEGGMDAEDIQTYFKVRDDRVAVIFKNGYLMSVVSSLEEFEGKLEALGL